MKMGIIGAGMIVHDFLSFYKELNGVEVVSICATPRGKERVKELIAKHDIPTYYTDVEEMFKKETFDIVYVASPNHLHYEHTKLALENNAHVICEKPFTSNLQELENLCTQSKETGKMIIEAVTTRYLPNFLKIKEDIKELGEIKIVTANYSQYSSRYDAFKEGEILPAFNYEMSGGALMDLNIYNINFVVSLFGKPKDVEYYANVSKGIDTSGILTLDYGDFKAVCIGAKDCKAPVMTSIQGDQGNIIIETPTSVITTYKMQKNKDADMKEYTYNNDKHRMYHEFVSMLEMIATQDQSLYQQMLEISLLTMEVQTIARKKAGIIFPADK